MNIVTLMRLIALRGSILGLSQSGDFGGFRLFWLPGELGGSFPLVLQEGRLEVFAYLWVFSEEAFHEGWPHSMDTGPWWIEVLE
jgi:hypothetical protein